MLREDQSISLGGRRVEGEGAGIPEPKKDGFGSAPNPSVLKITN